YALVPDSFAAYADTLGNSETFAFFDIWGSLADITQDFFTLAKLYTLTADPWANLGATAPTIAKTANLAVAPAADAMTMADQPVTVLKLAPKEFSLPADSMTLADSMRIGWALNFVDDLQNWQDTLQNSIAFRLTDDLNNWQDQPQIAAGGALRPVLTADPMAMGDQPVTI